MTLNKKVFISKSDWEKIAKKYPWIKVSMATWLPDDIKGNLREDNWLIDVIGDRVPPEVGITALRNIDPDIALSLPRIYPFQERDVREIEGRRYIIIDVEKPKVRTRAQIKAIDIESGDVVSFDREEVLPIIDEQIVEMNQETLTKVNEEISKYNERLDAIERASSNITLLPLQLGRVSNFIDERVEDLDGIIETQRNKMDGPKPEAMTEWETGIENVLLTGDLDEADFVDTVLHSYKYRYDEMVRDLQAGTIVIPANIDDPEFLKRKLVNIGELAFQQYIESIEKRRERGVAPGVPFDIETIDFPSVSELDIEQIPKSYKAKGYRSWEAYMKSLNQQIQGSENNKNILLNVKQGLNELGVEIGSLEAGQRSNDFLRNTEEGRAIVNDMTDFINDTLGPFITQYKSEIIDRQGNLDTKKMGRSGTVGNAFLVIALARLYNVISRIIRNVGMVGTEIERELREPGVEEVEEVTSALSKSEITKLSKKISELLCQSFKQKFGLK